MKKNSLHLVTGGAGFIGSHIAEALVALGRSVRIVDDLSSGRCENIAAFRACVEFIEGDISDPKIAARAVENVDVIFHEAAIPSVPLSVENPFATQRAGEIATLTLLDAAVKASARRIVFAASCSAYGDSAELPLRESIAAAPLSPYAASKLACEGYMTAFAACHPALDTVSLRYFNIFGPRQDPTSFYSGVIAKFTELMSENRVPTIFGDGEQTRDFCFVENAVSANLLAADSPQRFAGATINIGCGRATSLNQLVQFLNKILGTSLEPKYEDARAGDIRHSLAEISEAERLLGYKPLVHIEEGLRKLIEWKTAAQNVGAASLP